MKIKLLVLSFAVCAIAVTLIPYSSNGLNTPTADELAAQNNADNYNRQADKYLNAAAMWAKTESFQDRAESLKSLAASEAHLADLEMERESRLRKSRVNYYNPIHIAGIIFGILCPSFLTLAWLVPGQIAQRGQRQAI